MSHNGITTEQAQAVWGDVRPALTRQHLPQSGILSPLENILLDVDSYKNSHVVQYPTGTTHIYSYIESRGSDEGLGEVLFFGLQAYLKRYLSQPITVSDIYDAAAFWKGHGLPFNVARWMHIVDHHAGRLPVEIRALPEGIVVPTGTPLLTIVNTDPECFWLTSFLETSLLRAIWYPTTVATISRACKLECKRAFDRTSDDYSSLSFKLHDFGARGVSSQESAALGGMAHLVNFMGTDTVSGVLAAREFYGEPMAGFSIPAAEHSTITSWGKEHETDAYSNILDQFGDGMVAIVADSYNIKHAVLDIFGDQLKQKVLDMKGTLIVRPDSGDPVTMPVEVVKMLDARFGSTVNSKGFKVLNPKVRVIQGDGINRHSLHRIIYNLTEVSGYAIDNLAFGMGGGLLQHCNRDTFKFAMKCSAALVNGEWRDVYKAPVGQPDKKSKRGRFKVHNIDGEIVVRPIGMDLVTQPKDLLQPVWRDGELLVDHSFAEVRARAAV